MESQREEQIYNQERREPLFIIPQEPREGYKLIIGLGYFPIESSGLSEELKGKPPVLTKNERAELKFQRRNQPIGKA